MKARLIVIVAAVALLLTMVVPASFAEMDYENTYETALRLAKNDLTNISNLNDAVVMLNQIGSFGFTRSYLLYLQQLVGIQSDNPDLETAKLMLELCQDNSDFMADLDQRGFPSCSNLLAYIEARGQEENGNFDAACSAYRKMSILDAPDRAANLALKIASATPAPTIVEASPTDTPTSKPTEEPTATPTPTATPQPIPSVPVLSETYPGSDAHLRKSNDDGYRVYSYVGPGKAFVPSGGYKPYKQRKITVYFEEDGFVLADVLYQTAEERVVYLPKYGFDSIGNIPVVSNLEYYNGITTASITPSWGPDNRFNSVSSLAVDKGVTVKVFFQENGFVYAEYVCGKGTVRMWLPADNVDITGATVTYSNTPITPAGQSSFK